MQFFNPFFKYDFDTFTGDATDCLVRDLKSLSITCCLFLPPSKHCSIADCFLCIYECTTPVINLFVDYNVWEYACFRLEEATVGPRQ